MAARTGAKKAPPPQKAHARGSPPHEPDERSRARVTAWAGGGIAEQMIAKTLGISRPTLRKHYKVELQTGRAVIDGLAVSSLVLAMQRGGKEAVTAAIWWQKSRMGWTEEIKLDQTSLAATPMRVQVEFVGDAAPDHGAPVRTREPYDASHLADLVG